MFEYVPFGFGLVLGAFAYRVPRRMRPLLVVLGALACGAAATLISGEYLDGWTSLPLDIVEAALGTAVALAVIAALGRARRRSR